MTAIMPAPRVGILGLSHDHVWGNVAALAAGARGRLVAASDGDPRLRERLHGLDGAWRSPRATRRSWSGATSTLC